MSFSIREFAEEVSGVVDAAMSQTGSGGAVPAPYLPTSVAHMEGEYGGFGNPATEYSDTVSERSGHGELSVSLQPATALPEVSDPDNDPCELCGHKFGEHAHDGHWCPSDADSGPLYLQTRFTDEGTRAAFRRDLNNWIVERWM